MKAEPLCAEAVYLIFHLGCQSGASERVMTSWPNQEQGKDTLAGVREGPWVRSPALTVPVPPFALQPRAQLWLGGFPKVGGFFGCLLGSSALGVSEPKGPFPNQLPSWECL